MNGEREKWQAVEIITGVIIVAAILLVFGLCSGCTAIPSVAGYFTSGGVTLYKKANESGPKAEFVALKISHDIYNVQVASTPAPTCRKCVK